MFQFVMSRNYLLRDPEWEISARSAVKPATIHGKERKMTRLPRHATAVMILLFGFTCATAGAAQVTILAPEQHGVVHDNAGNLVVQVKVEPSINEEEGTSIRILLDGKPAAQGGAGTSFALKGLERGEHWLQAMLVDGKGKTLSVSDTVYFTIWQASVNSPVRQGNKK
jgi:hypothetical protein